MQSILKWQCSNPQGNIEVGALTILVFRETKSYLMIKFLYPICFSHNILSNVTTVVIYFKYMDGNMVYKFDHQVNGKPIYIPFKVSIPPI